MHLTFSKIHNGENPEKSNYVITERNGLVLGWLKYSNEWNEYFFNSKTNLDSTFLHEISTFMLSLKEI
jgi:hypothetical protein